jgi:hypothetical protein
MGELHRMRSSEFETDRFQCCYAAYERSIDRIVGVFIPFYSEIKALLILFFLLTRARVSAISEL